MTGGNENVAGGAIKPEEELKREVKWSGKEGRRDRGGSRKVAWHGMPEEQRKTRDESFHPC